MAIFVAKIYRASHSKVFLGLLFALIAFVYTLPIFSQFNNWGIQDWDQHLFYHAVPKATILDYGQIPLWNPYYVGGAPLLANPQSRVLAPSFFLTLLFGEVVGIKIEIWLYLVIGLGGAYVLARYYSLGRSAALMTSFVFMLNSMYALNLTVGMTWFLSVAYLPWVFLFYLKALINWKYILASGLCLVLMFFGGGVYPLSITLLFLGLYSLLIISFKEYGRVKVAKVLIITLVFMLCLGAVKFFPTIEFLHQHPRYIYDYSGFSLNSLYFSLFNHDQTLNAIEKLPIEEHGFTNGVTGAMDENGMYIGVIPFLLFLLGIGPHDKRRFFLFLCFLSFLWISFGNRPRVELWSFLHLLPVYNSMRVAQRFRIIFMLCLAILAGFGFQTIKLFLKRNIANLTVARFLSSGVLIFVLVDLLAANSLVFKDAFPIPPLAVTKSEHFYQVWEFPAYNKNGWINPDSSIDSDPFASYNPYGRYSSFGSLYPTFLSNIGTINGYETAEVPRNAVPISSDNYQGEVYLSGTTGSASISSWSPNEVIINVHAASEGFLILNQNYYSGWKVKGESERTPENKNGLLAVKISPTDRQLELYYLPLSFIIGSIVTAVTILISGFLLFGLTQADFLRRNHRRKIIIDTVRTNILHAVRNLSLGKSGL